MTVQKGIYQHYKGNEYEVIGIAKHSETGEDMVLYKPLYKTEWADLVVRPISIFMEDVEVNGTMVPRFKKIG